MIKLLISLTVGIAAIIGGWNALPVRGDDFSSGAHPDEQLAFGPTGEYKGAAVDPMYVDDGLSVACYDCGPVLYGEIEALFLRYSRADGVTNNAGDPNAQFDDSYTVMPRLTAGVVLNSGLGARLRYFDIDDSKANGNGDQLDIDARVVDLELFENIRITDATAVEWSIGFRHSDFSETIDPHPLLGNDVRHTVCEGLGLVAGLEVNRLVRWGSIYGRARGALLLGDRDVMAPGAGLPHIVQNDVTAGMVEFAAGWEISRTCHNGMVFTAGMGWEVQQWINHSTTASAAVPVTAPADVGFNGAVFNVAVGY